MARDTTGGIVKLGLLVAGGYFVYRWWAEREVEMTQGGDGTPAGITPAEQALLDSARRTSAGGPQPGDTSSVNGAAEETPDDGSDNDRGDDDDDNGGLSIRRRLLSRAEADPDFDGLYNTHQWNYVLRAATGISEAQTPDMAGVGSPLDALTVDQYLARRTLAGLTGMAGLSGMRGLGQLRRARYPVWLPRPGGRSACGCASTGCNCYRV